MRHLFTIRAALGVFLALLLPAPATTQGFAGLGQSAAGFAIPQRGTALAFPKDHAAHPDFRIEWWYITANLTAEDGTPYGVQWTLFRSALAPNGGDGWDSKQLWMGHAALTTPDAHYVAERLGRGGIGQAGVTLSDGFDAWIDEWSLSGAPDLSALSMSAGSDTFGYEMTLTARGPLVLHGDRGYSVKSQSGQASYYYSQPFFDISGDLRLPDGTARVSGHAWLDREWSSQPLAQDQKGWDWFSLVFDDGARMMGFVLRSADGDDYSSGTWIDAAGTATPLPGDALEARALAESEVAGRSVPTSWQVLLPSKGLDVTVTALNPQSWMSTSVPYWEGPVTVSGSHPGRGYLEMTGY